MKNRVFFLIAVATLAGCQATAPQQPKQTAADDPSSSCFVAIGYNTQLRVIEPKIGALNNIKTLTLEQLARSDTATPEDKPLLSLWASERNRCVEAGVEFRRQHQPSMYVGIIERQNEEFTILLSKLYAGQITYGQFNTQRKELAVQSAERWAKARTSEQQTHAANQQALTADRARSAAEFSNALMLMQAAQPRPTQAPPFSAHCQSRNVSGTIYTNCQ